MSIWLRIGNVSAKIELESYRGFSYRFFEFGAIVQLGCFGVSLYWDMRGALALIESEYEARIKEAPSDLTR